MNPQVDQHSFGVTYAERPLLFHNSANGKFEEIATHTGPALSRRYVARGAATADFFNEGKQDLLVSVLDGSPLLLRNKSHNNGHWLSVKAIGVRSNRDGFGARIQVKAAGLTQSAEVRANSSFESASDPRLHFGLGYATQVDSVEVHWPSGVVDRIGAVPANQEITIEEGRGIVRKSAPQIPPKKVPEARSRRR